MTVAQIVLAAVQDLLLGQGTAIQERNGVNYTLDKINSDKIPYLNEPEDDDFVSIKDQMDKVLYAKAIYDFTVNGGAVKDHNMFVLPDNAYIVESWYEVVVALESLGSATIAMGVQTNDTEGILAETDFDDSNAFGVGPHDTLVFPRAANFTTKTTADRNVVLTIGTAALTAGQIYLWCKYIVSE